jgi:hypothetical protein
VAVDDPAKDRALWISRRRARIQHRGSRGTLGRVHFRYEFRGVAVMDNQQFKPEVRIDVRDCEGTYSIGQSALAAIDIASRLLTRQYLAGCTANLCPIHRGAAVGHARRRVTILHSERGDCKRFSENLAAQPQ